MFKKAPQLKERREGYSVKYLFTRGIEKVTVIGEADNDFSNYVYLEGVFGIVNSFRVGKNFFFDVAEARKEAELLVADKIYRLEKQISNLETLNLDIKYKQTP
jgi:hypothetical protein